MVTMTDEQTLTVAEVASRLRVSTATVTNWLRERKLRGYRLGGKKAGWRIDASEVERFVKDRKREAGLEE